LFITRETVATETPACFATSRIVIVTLAPGCKRFQETITSGAAACQEH
jgi:hypothetical protein